MTRSAVHVDNERRSHPKNRIAVEVVTFPVEEMCDHGLVTGSRNDKMGIGGPPVVPSVGETGGRATREYGNVVNVASSVNTPMAFPSQFDERNAASPREHGS